MRGRVNCCEGCGRDCYGLYCRACAMRGNRWASKMEGRPADDTRLPLEDDYGDEADADSVCEDNQ